jgi:hypothetical protein
MCVVFSLKVGTIQKRGNISKWSGLAVEMKTLFDVFCLLNGTWYINAGKLLLAPKRA